MSGKRLRAGEKLTSSWDVQDEYVVRSYNQRTGTESLVTITTFAADYRTRDGFEHYHGAWRVTATTEDGKSYQRPQTFYGETAHYDAKRAADDIIFKARYE